MSKRLRCRRCEAPSSAIRRGSRPRPCGMLHLSDGRRCGCPCNWCFAWGMPCSARTPLRDNWRAAQRIMIPVAISRLPIASGQTMPLPVSLSLPAGVECVFCPAARTVACLASDVPDEGVVSDAELPVPSPCPAILAAEPVWVGLVPGSGVGEGCASAPLMVFSVYANAL